MLKAQGLPFQVKSILGPGGHENGLPVDIFCHSGLNVSVVLTRGNRQHAADSFSLGNCIIQSGVSVSLRVSTHSSDPDVLQVFHLW